MPRQRFHVLLQEKIEKQVQSLASSLVAGNITDWAHYKETVGYLRGLDDALKLCDEIERDYD